MGMSFRLIIIIICCVLVSIPFLIVQFPPITDLPQHVSQIRLFQEAISDADSPYKIQWLTPYNLVYVIIGFCWVLFGPLSAGPIAMLILAVSWTIFVHLLSIKLEKDISIAIIAMPFFFCHIMYWGFYQFVLGWIVFLGGILLIKRKPKKFWKESIIYLLFFTALYFSHILWFFVGVGWLVLQAVIFERKKIKLFSSRIIGAVPFLLLISIWYPTISAYGFKSETVWATTPFDRFSFSWFVDSSLGGIKGSVEYIVFSFVLLWIIAALWQNRNNLRKKIRIDILLLFGCLFLGGFILPDKMVNTIRFSQRWIPPAMVFLLIALPVPRIFSKKIRQMILVLMLMAFILITSLTWLAFEVEEMTGLREALNNLPDNTKVIGLDYIGKSDYIRGRPFIQTFAYAQVMRGGILNFSFADFGPSLVIYKEPRQKPWTRGLEWHPEKAKIKDFYFFDYALINGIRQTHEVISSRDILSPLQQNKRWRTYKINKKVIPVN
jgi:hypothetical protein